MTRKTAEPPAVRWIVILRGLLLALVLGACAGAPPRDTVAPRPEPGRTGEPLATPPPGRSLEAIASAPPRSIVAVHLAHIAQIALALRDPANDFDERLLRETWRALGETAATAGADDLALARDLAAAAPALAPDVLEALTTSGFPGDHRRVSPEVAALVDRIVLEGPAAAKTWALANHWSGARGDARTFVRGMLGRAAAEGRCPAIDEEVGHAVDELFGDRRDLPCLDGAPQSPDALAALSAAELLTLVETGGQTGEAAAIALRTKVQQADGGAPGALAALLPASDFGRLLELAARGGVEISLVVQLLSSAHNEPAWIDWLAEHPDRVGPDQREFAAMLLEQDDRAAARERSQAAAHRLRTIATSTLPPAGRDFRMPDQNPSTFAQTWQLAATVTQIGAIEGVYGELMRNTVLDRAQQTVAARNDATIAGTLSRCQALVQARPAGTWVERALQDATADACSNVAQLAANIYTPRLKAALLDGLRAGPDPWVREVYKAIELAQHEGDVPAAVGDSVLARPRVRQALLMLVTTETLWSRVPAAARTEEAILAAVARAHGETLLGANADRVGPPERAPDVRDIERAYFVTVSSSELPDVPPLRLHFGVMRHAHELRPIDVARLVP